MLLKTWPLVRMELKDTRYTSLFIGCVCTNELFSSYLVYVIWERLNIHRVKNIFMCSKFGKIYREECDKIECLMTEFLHVMHASTHALTIHFISVGLSCFIIMNNIKDITRIMLNPTTVISFSFLKVLDSLMTTISMDNLVFSRKSSILDCV